MNRDVWVVSWREDDGWEVILLSADGVSVTLLWDEEDGGRGVILRPGGNSQWEPIPWPWPDFQPLHPGIVIDEAERLSRLHSGTVGAR